MRNYQQSKFQDAHKILSSKIGNNQKLGSNIACLNPFLDSDGLIRVGGRLKQSSLEWSVVHPILLPRKGSITKLIVKWCHEKAAHSGRNITLNEVRSSGYWVLQGNSFAKQIISKCVTCRRLRGRVGEQLMADLPSDRFQKEPPFTPCGVDMFGPFHIKERRNTLKRYGVLFTCLVNRLVHIEMTKTMDTDSSSLLSDVS